MMAQTCQRAYATSPTIQSLSAVTELPAIAIPSMTELGIASSASAATAHHWQPGTDNRTFDVTVTVGFTASSRQCRCHCH
jgi:hypothetical protein